LRRNPLIFCEKLKIGSHPQTLALMGGQGPKTLLLYERGDPVNFP
jgi:hypothetical protein